jgi:ferrous iron transport protein A
MESLSLDSVPFDQPCRIVAVDWDRLVPEEARRLRALGLEEGAKVRLAHKGVFGGSDPLAVVIGRMTVAVRRVHASAMTVAAIAPESADSTPAGVAA